MSAPVLGPSERAAAMERIARLAGTFPRDLQHANHLLGEIAALCDPPMARDDALAIALVTEAPQSEFPPPDRMRLHGVWYDRSANQEDQ